jgi:hypothetical protein
MTLNQFAKKLAQIHNESGLLYSDMLDQETLFNVQDQIIDLLIEAQRDGSVSQAALLEFNHIFSIK